MKKVMVIFAGVAFVLCIFMLAYGQSPEGTKPQEKIPIEQRKAKIISSIDERIKMLQEDKACVSAAQTHEDLRKCREKSREERKDLREERKDQRKK